MFLQQFAANCEKCKTFLHLRQIITYGLRVVMILICPYTQLVKSLKKGLGGEIKGIRLDTGC